MQTGAYESVMTGVFAIAYATDIAYSLDPASSLFIQGRMRRHLYQCLNAGAGRLTPFPWKATSTTLTCGMGKRDEIEVTCYCRMPSLKDMEMIECSVCFQKVHSLCDDLATTATDKDYMVV